MIAAMLVSVMLQAPSWTPVELNKPPEWSGWKAFDQSVQAMQMALQAHEPKFGKLPVGSYQCLFAKMGIAMSAIMRYKRITWPGQGRAPALSQALGPKIDDLERYFKSEEARYCNGKDGELTDEAIRLLNKHGYSPTTLARSGGQWDHIGETPVYKLPAGANVEVLVGALVAAAVLGPAAPVLVVPTAQLLLQAD